MTFGAMLKLLWLKCTSRLKKMTRRPTSTQTTLYTSFALFMYEWIAPRSWTHGGPRTRMSSRYLQNLTMFDFAR